jgi:hypothetical protein
MPRLSKIGAAALAAFGWTGLQSVTASYLVVAGGGAGGSLVWWAVVVLVVINRHISLNPTSYTVHSSWCGAGGYGQQLGRGSDASLIHSLHQLVVVEAVDNGGIRCAVAVRRRWR